MRHPNVEAYFPSLESHDGGPRRVVRLSVLRPCDVQSDSAFDHLATRTRGAGTSAVAIRPVRRMQQDLVQAIAWFEREFPGRFEDPEFIRHEITYKREAHDLYVARLGGGRGAQLLTDRNDEAIAHALKEIWHKTSIPSRYEIMAANDGLKEPSAALRLLEALFAFLEQPGADAFARLSDAVAALPAPASGSRVHPWPNVTLLPFFADPSRFIVMKPQIARDTAARMGRDLLYSATVKWDTYARLLDTCGALREELAPLGARDYIDVQSFMWVTRHLP